jgi:WXG100 family type VII secretion target
MKYTQVNFEELHHIATRLADEGEEMVEMHMRTRRMVDSLLYDGWEGLGSERFYDEMYEVILPALARLYEALSDAALTTRKISEIYGKAQADGAEGFNMLEQWQWPNAQGGG